MDENEIRVLDAAGSLICLRYNGATHEVELLDATGRPKLRSVMREPAHFDGRHLVVNKRASMVSPDGSSINDVLRWTANARVRPAPEPQPQLSETAQSTRAQHRKLRTRAMEFQSVSSIVGDVLMVLGLLAALGGLVVAADTESLSSAARFGVDPGRHLAVGVLIACVSVMQVAFVLLLRRLGSYVPFREGSVAVDR